MITRSPATLFLFLLMCLPLAAQKDNTGNSKRVETAEHIRYESYPLNDVLTDIAKIAGYKYFRNTKLDDHESYIVTGHFKKPAKEEAVSIFDELAFMYGCTGYLKNDTLYCLTEEQLEKLPRDRFLWKVRYISEEDIPATTEKLRECFTAIDSKVEFFDDRNVLQIQGRRDEVEKAEKLLNELDSPTEDNN